MKLRLVLLALLTSVASISFAAEYMTLQTCIDRIEKDYPGQIISMEVESENGVISYEFDIDTNVNGTDFFIEIECDAKNSQLSEFQLETYATDKHFQAKAKISVSEAEKAAIDKYNGEMLPAYYEPVYAFDKNAIGQCKQTDVLSSTIRPKAKPPIGHLPEQEMENN